MIVSYLPSAMCCAKSPPSGRWAKKSSAAEAYRSPGTSRRPAAIHGVVCRVSIVRRPSRASSWIASVIAWKSARAARRGAPTRGTAGGRAAITSVRASAQGRAPFQRRPSLPSVLRGGEEDDEHGADEDGSEVVVAPGDLEVAGQRDDANGRREDPHPPGGSPRHHGQGARAGCSESEGRDCQLVELPEIEVSAALNVDGVGSVLSQDAEQGHGREGQQHRRGDGDQSGPTPLVEEHDEQPDADSDPRELQRRGDRHDQHECDPEGASGPPCLFARDQRDRHREADEERVVGVHRRCDEVRQANEREDEHERRSGDSLRLESLALGPERPREDRGSADLVEQHEDPARPERELEADWSEEGVVEKVDERRIRVRVEARHRTVERDVRIELEGVDQERSVAPEGFQRVRRHREDPGQPGGQEERRAREQEARKKDRPGPRAPRTVQRENGGQDRQARERERGDAPVEEVGAQRLEGVPPSSDHARDDDCQDRRERDAREDTASRPERRTSRATPRQLGKRTTAP